MASVKLLSGKNMAITGGVTGIGRAIVLGYLSHGANVAVNHLGDSKSSDQFQSLVEEAAQSVGSKEEVLERLIEVPGDVGDSATGKKLVEATVQKWGTLDVFVSNAGVCEFKEFLEYVYPGLLLLLVRAGRTYMLTSTTAV
jgi:L-rhamnose 1-dehydrogenase